MLRAGALGDLIFTLPALDALRAAYPEAEIVLLGKPWMANLLHERPGPVDRVVIVPPVRGVGTPENAGQDERALNAFFAQMQAERFDIALQLHGGGRYSNPFVTRLGARVSAGLCDVDAAPLDRTMPYFYHQNERMRQLEAVALVGATARTLEPHLAVMPRDVDEANASSRRHPGRSPCSSPAAPIPGAAGHRKSSPRSAMRCVSGAQSSRSTVPGMSSNSSTPCAAPYGARRSISAGACRSADSPG